MFKRKSVFSQGFYYKSEGHLQATVTWTVYERQQYLLS